MALYLNKILPVFLLPTGMAIALLLLGLFRRRWGVVAAALALLWLGSTALVSEWAMRAVEGWQVRLPVADLPQADAIVVLSGALVDPPGDAAAVEYREAIGRC